MTETVSALIREIAAIGADKTRGGYSRPGWSTAELDLRSWFVSHAEKRGLEVETDRNGVIWAWHVPTGSREGAVVTGSHLDSVPGGGAFDGPLGVAAALVAFDRLKASASQKPRAIAVFPEEEGSRFGVACLGSRLMTGAIDPNRALKLVDTDGTTLAEALSSFGLAPGRIGADRAALSRIDHFVELHVEQGRGLVDLDRPVGLASSILGHGRWRINIAGEGNHAGTTLMEHRRDPMVAAAALVVRIRDLAREVADVRATVGRIIPVPGGTNVIASRVDMWMDLRHPEDSVTHALVERVRREAQTLAASEGCVARVVEESFSETVDFDPLLRSRLVSVLDNPPVLSTGAGHDAGVLKGHVSTAMLFVRNPSGISHSPEEYVEDVDAEAGAVALADALGALLG